MLFMLKKKKKTVTVFFPAARGTYMIQVNQGRLPSVEFPVPIISWHTFLFRFPQNEILCGQITANLFIPHPLFDTFAE